MEAQGFFEAAEVDNELVARYFAFIAPFAAMDIDE